MSLWEIWASSRFSAWMRFAASSSRARARAAWAVAFLLIGGSALFGLYRVHGHGRGPHRSLSRLGG